MIGPKIKGIIERVHIITDVFGWGEIGKFKFYNSGMIFWLQSIYVFYDGQLVFQSTTDAQAIAVFIEGEWVSSLENLFGEAVVKHYTERYTNKGE